MPEHNHESVSMPTAGPSVEANYSSLVGNRLRTVAATAITAAGLSLAFIVSEAPNAYGAKLAETPEATLTIPEIEPVAELEDNLVIERPGPLEVGIAAYNSEHDSPGTLYDLMKQLGMNGVRLSLVKERYLEDLSDIREQLPNIRANGIEPRINLGQVKGAPLEGFPEWAAAMTLQLPGVKNFVIQNEVNSPLFSNYTVQESVDLQYRTYKAIKAVRPDAQVGAFGLASQYDPLGFFKAAASYAAKKYGGLKNAADIYDFHVYYQPDKARAFLNDIGEIWDGPIGIGEAGYGVKDSGQAYSSDGFVTKAQHSEFTVDMVKIALENPQIIYLYNYRMTNSPDPMDLKTGLITATGEKLPAFFALKAVLPRLLPTQLGQ